MNTYNFKIEAQNESGAYALDFIVRKFKTASSALAAFDDAYSRKGFEITIYKDLGECGEWIVSRIVKSSFR